MTKQLKRLTPKVMLPILLAAGFLYWAFHATASSLSSDSLLSAAENGDTATVANLLKSGANIEAKNVTGMTPLMRAAEYGQNDTVRFLLQHGANINTQDTSGFTPLRVAASPGGHADTVALLLQAGANPDMADKEGNTALIWASAYGNAATVKTLLAHKALVNKRDTSGKTALAMALGDKQEMTNNAGNPESAKLLLKAGGKT